MSDTRLDFITSDSKNFLTSDGLQYRVKGQADPDHTVTITLYQCSAEANRIDKSNYLTSVGTLTGVFRAECSITNPVILYEKETILTPVMPRFNYVYINQFQRYYFVKDLTSVNTSLWRMDLEEDPLYTYETGIGNLSAFVERNENTYDDLLRDEYQTFKNTNTYQFALPSTHSLDFNVDDTDSEGNEYYRYVASGLALITSITASSFETFQREFCSNLNYLLNKSKAFSFSQELMDLSSGGILEQFKKFFTNEPYQVISSFKAYPFDVKTWYAGGTSSSLYNLNFAGLGMTTTGYQLLPSAAANLNHFRSFNLTSYGTNWADYDDIVELYLPFAGITALDARDVYGKYVVIKLTVDFATGKGTYSIYASEVDSATDTKYLTSASGQMGIDIPIASENIATKLRTTTSTMAGLMSSAAGGFLTGSLNTVMDNFRPQVTPIGGSNTDALPALFNPLEAFIRIARKTRVTRDYASLRGYPLRQVKTLSTLTGFTQCGDVHVEGSAFKTATIEETRSIADKLKTGVIL